MNAPANVQSLESVREFRGQLLAFGEQATDCLESLHAQVHRMIDWLEHDRPAYWQHLVRRGHDQVAEARLSLQRCQMRTVGEHRPDTARVGGSNPPVPTIPDPSPPVIHWWAGISFSVDRALFGQ